MASSVLPSLEFELILADDSSYPQKGTFYALDRNVDVRTGAIRFEVRFPNPEGVLRPGHFARVRATTDIKTDPNIDQILAQLRVSQAASQLPADVNNYEVTVVKSTSAPLMLIAIYSPKDSYDNIFLANYAYINLVDQVTRVHGISNVQVFGAGQYAMRLWVKPDQLAKLNLTVAEIVSAIKAQNNVNPAGQIGSEPVPPGQGFTYTVRAQGRLSTPAEFSDIVVRAGLCRSRRRLPRQGGKRLVVFTVVAFARFGAVPKWNNIVSFALIIGAVYFTLVQK